MNTSKRVSRAKLRSLMINKLQAQGYNQYESGLISDDFLDNEVLHKKYLGINAFIKLLGFDREKAKSKTVKIKTGHITIFDMGGKFAHCSIDEIVNLLTKNAKKNGVAAVGIRNNTTFTSPAYPVKRLVEKNVIGLCFMFVGARTAAPSTIREPLFGTNPISIGIPSNKEYFIYDTSTTTISRSRLKVLGKQGVERMDYPIGIDNKGNVTNIIKETTTLLPFGLDRGLGLSIAVETMAGLMLGYDIGEKKNKYTANNGILLVAFDPEKYSERQGILSFKKQFTALLSSLKKMSRGRVHIPGENYSEIIKSKYITIDINTLKYLL